MAQYCIFQILGQCCLCINKYQYKICFSFVTFKIPVHVFTSVLDFSILILLVWPQNSHVSVFEPQSFREDRQGVCVGLVEGGGERYYFVSVIFLLKMLWNFTVSDILEFVPTLRSHAVPVSVQHLQDNCQQWINTWVYRAVYNGTFIPCYKVSLQGCINQKLQSLT